MKTPLLILLIIFLSGCFQTMSKEDVEVYRLQTEQQNKLIEYHRELSKNATYEATCEGPCNVKIYDGDELPPLPVLHHFVGPYESNAMMFDSGADMVRFGVPWIAGTKIVSDVMDATGDGDTSHSTNTINGDDNQITRTDSTTDSSRQITSGDTATRSATETNATTMDNRSTFDNHSINNSYNPDSTSEPTIVKPSIVRP